MVVAISCDPPALKVRKPFTFTNTYMWQFRSFSQVSGGDGESGTNWESSIDIYQFSSVQFSCSVMSDSLQPHGYQASLSITNSQSLLKLMSIKSVVPSNHLILCHSLFLLPSVFTSIRVFSNESALRIRWPKYWRASASVLPMNIQDWFPLGLTGWISSQSKELSILDPRERQIFYVKSLSTSPSVCVCFGMCTFLLHKQKIYQKFTTDSFLDTKN